MRRVWQGIYRYWSSGDKVGFFVIILALVIVIGSMIVTAQYLGKLLSAISLSKNR